MPRVSLLPRLACLLPLVLPLSGATADGYDKPDPEQAFAEMKFLQPDGSVYRTPREEWEGARRRVADDPRWTDWAKKKQAEVDAWMARNRDRTTWVAGRGHDFVSPKDGSFLVWTEDVPGEDVPTLKSATGHDVEVTPKIFAAWVDKFRKAHVDMTTEAARLYRLTGDARYAEWAAGQLDFYAENLMKWPLSSEAGHPGRLGVMAFNDAVMLTRLLETARLVFDHAGAERRQMWFEKLFKPEAELLETAYKKVHNHTVWERTAQAMIALLYRDETLWRQAVDGELGIRDLLRRGVTGDYLWHEQSVGYNDFVIMALQPLLTFTGLLGEEDRIRKDAAIVQNMMLVTTAIRFPDGTVPNPANSTAIPRAPSGRIRQSYRILPTPLGLARAADTYSWDTLVDPPAEIEGPRSTDLPAVVSRNLESSRFALLREGDWQVFFHYGQLVHAHSQAEALNWSASFGKVVVTRDPGTVGYGSPLANGYFRQGLNHNVPLVGGQGQRPWKRGELLRFDAAESLVSAAQPDYRDGSSARRTLRIEGDTLTDEARVELPEGSAPRPLGLSLHLQGTALLGDSPFRPVSQADFERGRSEAFRYWTDVRSATFKDRASVDVEFPGGLTLRVEFEHPGEFTLYTGSSPDRPPARRAGFYLEAPAGAREATFLTRLRPLAR